MKDQYNDQNNQVEKTSLLDSLDQEWLKLPISAMVDVGQATQTLAGILRIANKETYVPVYTIAKKARLPVATTRKHLRTLHDGGWILNLGRQRTRRRSLRRTATIKVTPKTRAALAQYSVLPWWACCSIRPGGRLQWSTKAVLSIVMARLMSLKAAVEQQDGHGADPDDLIGSIENFGGDDRFRFSLKSLESQTGLSRHSIICAKKELHSCGILRWTGGMDEQGGTQTDVLAPNWNFAVIETPASPGRVYLDFDRGCKSGR